MKLSIFNKVSNDLFVDSLVNDMSYLNISQKEQLRRELNIRFKEYKIIKRFKIKLFNKE